MHFAFTDDQIALRDAVRDLLVKECPPAAVRSAGESSTPTFSAAWRALAEMGVLGVLAADDVGGLGLTDLDLVLVLEETGYAALPEPIVEHAAVAVPLLDDPTAAITGSELISATAPNDQIDDQTDDQIAPSAELASAVVVWIDKQPALVPRDQIKLVTYESVDHTRRIARLDFDPQSATPLTSNAIRANARGVVGLAAQLIGLTRRMLDLTVEYASTRKQFGVPIGSFQAVKHHLADARIALEFARPLVYRAAWSLASNDPDAELHASMAKAMAGDAALLTASKALQCHGAIGYSFEYDLHLFMKRAWVLAGTWGSSADHRARVGNSVL